MATVVKAKADESVDSLLRRFKKQVIVDEILPEVREREHYKSPSERRKEQRKERERLQRRMRRIS